MGLLLFFEVSPCGDMQSSAHHPGNACSECVASIGKFSFGGENVVPGRSLRARGDWPGNATTAVLCVMFIIKVRVITLLLLLRGLLSLLLVMNALF